MKYLVVNSAEYIYPDVFTYQSASDRAEIFGVKGGYATFQVVLNGVETEKVPVSCEGFDAELYSLYAVPVDMNPWDVHTEHMTTREVPFWVYDALMPYRGELQVKEGAAGIYVAVPIPRDCAAGTKNGALKIGDITVPVSIRVYDVQLPEESLKIIQGYTKNFGQYHGARWGSPEFNRLNDEYYACLRRMHQNMMYVWGVEYKEVEPNKYTFDFTGLEECIQEGLDHGMKYFNLPSIGGRKSWKESTILVRGDLPSMEYEAYCYLTQYLPALHEFLEKHGWLDRVVMGISDEPNEANATEFRALCGLVHRIVPDIKLIDAMSYGNLHGALDIWVPLNQEYSCHKKEIETFRANGSEIWQYVCCAPRWDGFINRFMDYPLLCTRMMMWGNYCFNLTGYLHWSVNSFQNGQSAYHPGEEYHQNPFINSVTEHHNADNYTYLSAGDTALLYPGGFEGNGPVQEPWLSVRAENQRESAEEYELLKALSGKNKALADTLCGRVFRDFNDIEYDVNIFNETRRELLEACEELLK